MPVESINTQLQIPVSLLPPGYSDLMKSARRMLQWARARCWSALLDEQVEFIRACDRVAEHESAREDTTVGTQEQELCETVHRNVADQVAEARRLLLLRQAELQSESEEFGSSSVRCIGDAKVEGRRSIL